MRLSSPQSKQFGWLRRLQQKKRTRYDEQLFWIEGQREVKRAVNCGWNVHTFVSSEDGELPPPFRSVEAPVIELTRELWSKLAYRESTEQIGAVVHMRGDELEVLDQLQHGGVLLEAVEKPGNIGAILRSVDATGGNVVASLGALDWYNPNMIRASVGARFALACGSVQADQVAEIASGRIVALTPDGDTEWQPGSMRPNDIVLLGAEATGLSEQALSLATVHMALPMRGQVDSLNVAQCATVLLYDRLYSASNPTIEKKP